MLITLLFAGCIQKELPPKEPSTPPLPPADDPLYCENDSDCLTSVEAVPQCNHYCIGDECNDTEKSLCNAVSRLSEEFKNRENINCIWNAPCTKPSKIECKNNLCMAS